jgi:type VI secretion system protein ImpM
MLCGMFGKLPSKRDFVSYNMPRPFLDHWEEWLQGEIATSKHALASQWQDIFLGMPIWRFWHGSHVFGQAVTGALMPSVDGIGRYFPLSICACQPEGMRLTAPPSDSLDEWHAGCERFLLRMLEDELGEDPSSMLGTLPFPPVGTAADAMPKGDRRMVWTSSDGSLNGPFKALHAMDEGAIHGHRSYWWTNGGVAHKAQLVVTSGKADLQILAALMTGNFNT